MKARSSVVQFPTQPWPERGDELTPEHTAYCKARSLKLWYIIKLCLRSAPDGMLIPYPDPRGGWFNFGRKRLIPAQSGQKFQQQRGSPPHFYFAPPPRGAWAKVLTDPAVDLYIIEGEIHAAAVAQHGGWAIGLGGVWNFRAKDADGGSAPIADFDLIDWRGRAVTLVYDADIRTNRDIQGAPLRLGALLEEKYKARVSLVIVPDLGDGKSGADDFIEAKGIKAFRALPRLPLDDPEFSSWGTPGDDPDAMPFTDAGCAAGFVALHGERVRYAAEWKKFLLWDGVRWRPDATGRAVQLGIELSKALLRQAARCDDSDRREAIASAAISLQAASRLRNVLWIAQTDPKVAVPVDALDAQPMLLAVANGVVDLEAGKLIEPRPEQLITKATPVAFDAAAHCPRFERFVLDVMGGRKDLAAYVQRMAGYLLTGSTREQCFFIWHGVGANGKSTLLSIIQSLLGEYATTSRMESWQAQKRAAGGASEDIARLHGTRLVSAVEAEENERLAESLVKEITGGDRVSARRLYEGTFEFTPQFKLVLVCNHRPIVRGDDPAIWRRLKLIPFERVFAADEQDRTLLEQLRAELPGILNWAIKGCLDWQRGGFAEPAEILRATNAYRDDSDVLRQFLSERCDIEPNKKAGSVELYESYKQWADSYGHRPMTLTSLIRKLMDRGFTKRKYGKDRVTTVMGLGLTTENGGRY